MNLSDDGRYSTADAESASLGVLSPEGLYLRPEFFELSDYSLEGVAGVSEADREQSLGVRVSADVAEGLDGAAVALDGGGDAAGLTSSRIDVGHDEDLPCVVGSEAGPSDVPAMTVGDTTDTPSPGDGEAGASRQGDAPVASSDRGAA